MRFFFDGVRVGYRMHRVGQQVFNITFDLTDCTSIDIYFYSMRWAGTTSIIKEK